MKRDDTVYLRHIVDAIHRIERHLGGVSRDGFFESELVQDAVVRPLEIIGEAARNVSGDFRHAHAEVPWTEIVGMRNRLIHAYFQVDLAIVWEIVEGDLPLLKDQIDRLILSHGGT